MFWPSEVTFFQPLVDIEFVRPGMHAAMIIIVVQSWSSDDYQLNFVFRCVYQMLQLGVV